MENTTPMINTLFGAIAITYFLLFGDNGEEVMCEEFTDLARARDCAWEYSASSGRPIQIFEEFGNSEHLIETIQA